MCSAGIHVECIPVPLDCGGSEWVLTDVADSRQLGTSERIRDKMVKLHLANHSSTAATPVATIGREGMMVRDLEERVRSAEGRAREAEGRVRSAEGREEERVRVAEEKADRLIQEVISQGERREVQRAQETEERARAADRRVWEAEQHAQESEERASTAERRIWQESEERARAAEGRVWEAEQYAQESEERASTAERRIWEAEQESEERARAAEGRVWEAEQHAQESEERARAAEGRVWEAEQHAQESEERARAAGRRVQEAEEHAQMSEERAWEGERRVQEAEQREQASEERAREAERRVREAEQYAQMSEERVQEAERRAQASEERARAAESDVAAERQWVVERREIHITEDVLGGGGWGEVKVAKFRGTKVAAKSLYQDIRSDYYRQLFIREMNMAARIRHPNLVQFIGASVEDGMVILTELMSTSLRRELEREDYHMTADQLIVISLDVAKALNYLHQMQPDPVIHRDISSANVLLESLPDQQWRAKVTDYGSVNFQQQLRTVGPGSIVYASPEASNPSLQSPKMDIFSFGVLLIEMCTTKFPELSAREKLIASICDPEWVGLIRRCTHQGGADRPSADQIITELQQRLEHIN